MKQNSKWFKRWLLGLASLFIATGMVLAQEITISGTVTSSDDGLPVPGASVVEKGTNNGTITDFDGNFSLKVKQGSTIVISFIGMSSQELLIQNSGPYKVIMDSETKGLEEVVVTALGVKREKKALGYSMQEVKGDELLQAREANLANALTGKVSGVQIIRSSNGPGGSSKIQLRGSNSITGLNQPLIVVDGIPVDNFTGAANNDFWNPSADMGNGLSDINPDDIESMSVLKGASAAALYGSRAGNGVILITTKTGKKSKGLGVSVSSSLSIENPFMTPEMQSSFGQGTNDTYDSQSGSSWGPAITGQDYVSWDGSTRKMRSYDNVKNFFDTGINLTENISFSQQYDKASLYASLTRMDDKSMIPEAELSRTNMMIRQTAKFGANDRWSTDAKIQYIITDAKNRPISGRNDSNRFLTMYNFPKSLDIRDFSKAVDENGNMLWYTEGNVMNPYWSSKYAKSQDIRNRFLMNGSLKYDVTNWLNAEIKAGTDIYFTEVESKTYGGSPRSITGFYSFGEQKFYENNFSFLVSARQDNILGNWGGAASFGGNLMKRTSTSLDANAGELEVKNLFKLNNGKNKPSVNEGYSQKRINSLYGTLQINYNGWAFIDGTFRNDWTSTLSKDNRSFFYPSISGSWVISDMMRNEFSGMPIWFTYAKARVSYAEVGNDMDPYQLYNTYNIDKDPNGNTTTSQGSVLYNPNVKNELIKSWEVGAEIRFFSNRLGLDFTWYKSNATNQLLNIPMNPLSGYNSRKINAGNIQNKGIEIMLSARPIDNLNGLNWDLMLNYSNNENKIISLEEGIDRYSLGGYDNLTVFAVSGGNYGEIWGTKYNRVEDKSSPYYGQIIIDGDGLPTASSSSFKLGDQQAKGLLGLTNTFSYKGLSLSFLIDARIGGEIFSATNQNLQYSGSAKVTTDGGKRNGIVAKGVVSDGAGGYIPNTKSVSNQLYWQAIGGRSGNLGIAEANIYDATNIRLRNVSVNYSLPKHWIASTPFQSVKVGANINNVWMIKSHLNGVDPESVYATSTNAVGFEGNSSPTSRTYLFNVSFSF